MSLSPVSFTNYFSNIPLLSFSKDLKIRIHVCRNHSDYSNIHIEKCLNGFSRQEYCHCLLQGIFPTQGSNLGLLHYRLIPYHLSHQGSLKNICCNYEIIQSGYRHGKGSVGVNYFLVSYFQSPCPERKHSVRVQLLHRARSALLQPSSPHQLSTGSVTPHTDCTLPPEHLRDVLRNQTGG